MRERRVNAMLTALLLVGILTAPVGAQQSDQPEAAEGSGTQSLPARQDTVRARLQRLEDRMLKLIEILDETEPEKADRLRAGLDYAGKQRLKSRAEILAKLLRDARLAEAEQGQQEFVADLEALLDVLTSENRGLDRKREFRKQLEALRERVTELQKQQQRHWFDTQRARKSMNERGGAQSGEAARPDKPEEAEREGAEDPEARRKFREIERLQRQTQQQTDDVAEALRRTQQALRPRMNQQQPTPGEEGLENAADQMQQAADQLGRMQPQQAEQHEEQALQELQEALDELEETLRQLRQEEMLETLAALEARLRNMLKREQAIRDVVVELADKPLTEWRRVEQLQVAENAQAQADVVADCDETLFILREEGTTVIVPDILAQSRADMEAVARQLAGSEVTPATVRLLDDIIAALEELLAAVEHQREELMEQMQQGGGGGSQGTQPLLPSSAELKLLKSAQIRVNERTDALAQQPPEQRDAVNARQLSQRQEKLRDLTRVMNERK